MYLLLDAFFIGFHTVLILFNLVGWIWVRTRKLHLATIGLTAFSWLVMGFFYGWGYCFCTDWHWQVRRRMGDTDLPASYITFLVEQLTGWAPGPALVDTATALLFAAALAASLYVNFAGRPDSGGK